MARVECSKRGRRACVDSIEIFGSRPVVDVLRRGPRQIRRRLFREARRDEDDLRAYRDLRAARPDADVEAAAGPPVDGQRLGSVSDVERVARLEGLEVAHEVVRGRVVRLGEVAHERRPLVGEQAVPVVAEREVRALRLGDSTSLQREFSARARSKKSIHASRPFREMIARPKISRNEWKMAEI